jgi:hypothetical protein
LPFGLFAVAVSLVATLQKQCGSTSQKREKASRPIGCGVVLFKRVVVFFFVKILTIKAGYTRMYLPYKNAYKKPFCPNIKVLTRRKNEGIYAY